MSNPRKPQILDVLTSVLKDSILLPGSEEYQKENGSYFSAFENEIKPSYIVKPTSVKQVQDLVEALRPHVLSGDCRLAIRGHGHTPFAGSANVHNGVTIDMRGFKGVTLSEDKSVVQIGVGETWATVYAELEKHGLTVAGGRVGRIGVAGFILGGGLSMFSTRRGFACDSVVEFEVVLASGEVILANAGENADLWNALKGGLNNFGVLTSFKMKTFESGNIWGGVTYYVPGAFSQLLQNACDFVYNETDEDTHIMCSAGYGFGHQAVTCVMYHTRGEENPPSLQRFTALEPQIKQMCTVRTSTHLGFYISLMETFQQKWQETLDTIKDAAGFIFSFGFHPLTKALLENSEKAGGNAKAIPPSDGPLFVLLINPIWMLPEDDNRIFTAVENLVAEFRALASEKGLLHRYIFPNYAYQKDDIIAGYGEESVSKLWETGLKYDPEGIFQKGVPGGFKLPQHGP
ncbi:hypothetical protein DL771_005479 [Monosporascus sp. 5C6A]|nr:hypothetical protein DL771_005479 [Monosporascus sp. 5C6A]